MLRFAMICLVLLLWLLVIVYIQNSKLESGFNTTLLGNDEKQHLPAAAVAAGAISAAAAGKKKKNNKTSKGHSADTAEAADAAAEAAQAAAEVAAATSYPYLIDYSIQFGVTKSYLYTDLDEDKQEQILDVVANPVEVSRKYSWDLTPKGEIRSVHFREHCLTLALDLSNAYMSPCVYNLPSQRWVINKEGTIQPKRHNDLCLGFSDNRLYLAACLSEPSEIVWNIKPSHDPLLTVVLRLGLESVDRIRDATAFEDALVDILTLADAERFEVVLLRLSMETEDPILMLASQYRDKFIARKMSLRVLPSLLTGVSSSMHINNAVNNGGRFVTIIDHVSDIKAAGPYYLSNSVTTLFFQNNKKNVAISSSKGGGLNELVFSQGCRCLKATQAPTHDLSAILPVLAAIVSPVSVRSLWTRASGLHYMPMGSRSRRDCQMVDFWMTADVTSGVNAVYVTGRKLVNAMMLATPLKPKVAIYDACPSAAFVSADANSVAKQSTSMVDEAFIKSWLMLRNPELFTTPEVMHEQCQLVLSPMGFLQSDEFEAYKRKYVNVDPHVLFMDAMRQEGTSALPESRTSYNFLVLGSRLDGTRRISIWPYLYRNYLVARPEPIQQTTMEKCVQTLSFDPSCSNFNSRAMRKITKEEAKHYEAKIEEATASGRPIFHIVVTFKGGDNRFPYMSIESIFFHHADAAVFLHSDVMNDQDVQPFTSRQMDVTVVPFGMMRYASSESMFWFPLLVQHVEQLFIKEENWPYVFADLFKYWIIERFGGIYFEPDVILVKPIDLENMINTIGAKTGTISPDTLAEQADFEINGHVMIFEKGNAFVQRVMNFIPRTFNIDHPASTGYLLLTHTLMRSNNLRIEDDLVMADGVSVVAKDVFSPISAVKTNLKIFNSVLMSDEKWDNFVDGPSVVVHFYQRISGAIITSPGSFADRVLTSFCDRCEPPS